tara:strand:- start:1682 stop:1831 length:150 start_codon:yes stop_codon:yes gene_type:complete
LAICQAGAAFSPDDVCAADDGDKPNEKAAQSAALKAVGPHELEPWNKGL